MDGLVTFFQVILQVVFWIGLLALIGWVAWKIDRFGLKQMQARREREIEIAMRLGMADAERQERIAQKIMNERK